MYSKFKQFIYRRLIPFINIYKKMQWWIYRKYNKEIYLVLGAGPTEYKKWFSTDINTLDVTKEEDYQKYFKSKKIKKILAEHVLEHLTTDEIMKMNRNIYKYSDDDVNIRIAVPDGFHSDSNYINTVKPGGSGEGAEDHKHLFDYRSLSQIFEETGFEPILIEYWDENGEFHSNYDDDNGFVKRSFKNDKRNADGKPHYTSLIIDFKKMK